MRTKSTSDRLENGNEPPPLPEKERRPSITNSQDFFTSTPKSGLSLSDFSTPSNQSPHNSMIINSSHDSFYSIMDSSNSPLSVSPLSRSPVSSIGSGLNQSSEDLIHSANLRESRTNSFSRVHSESGIRGMQKCTSMSKSASQSDGTIDQINELTSKIDEMTKGIAKLTNQNGENPPPPLPQKRTQRQQSMYDNVTDSGINLSSRMEARMSSSSTSSSQSFSGFSISQKTTSVSYTHRTSSQETCSSSEAFSSNSHSSIDSLPKPPPLPPKKKHSKLTYILQGLYPAVVAFNMALLTCEFLGP